MYCPDSRPVPPPWPPSPPVPRRQSLMFLWTFQITSFAVLYSFGSVLSLMRWAATPLTTTRHHQPQLLPRF
jgi:hypothetical protein